VNQLDGVRHSFASKPISKNAFEQQLYRERHRIENTFAKLKRFRRIATRSEKLRASSATMLSLSCILLWLQSQPGTS
jgi:transposase